MCNTEMVSEMTQLPLKSTLKEGASDEKLWKKSIPSRGNNKCNDLEEKEGGWCG